MKRNVAFIVSIILNVVVIIGLAVVAFQNMCLNCEVKDLYSKMEIFRKSNEQQNLQITQLSQKIWKSEQEQNLKNLDTTDESIFENSSIEGLEPISTDEAKKVWDNYLTTVLKENIDEYDAGEPTTVKVKPTNRFTAGSSSNIKTADFERDAYSFNYTKKDNMGEVTGYVDMYTGKIIGGEYKGD